MRKYLIIAALILFGMGAQAQREVAIEHLKVLCSSEYAGRGYVNNGMQKAASYIVNQLKKHKIEPAALNKQYLQTVKPLAVNTFPTEVFFKGAFEASNTTINRNLKAEEFLIHPASGSISIKQKVLEIYDWHDAIKKSLKSEAVYYINNSKFEPSLTNEIIQYILTSTSLENTVLLVSDSILPAWYPSPNSSKNAVVYLSAVGKPIKIDAYWKSEFNPAFEANNVLGKVNGKRSDSAIMFTAHYDHLGMMGQYVFPGANDNASGVAMLLTLAQYYEQNPPEFDTYFLFTCAEEIGLLGSYHFVTNPTFELKRIKFLINLDLVGTGEEGIAVVNGEEQSQFVNLLKQNSNFNQIKIRGAACNSDHCYFDKAGIPAVFIYTLGGSKAYHNTADDAENPSLAAFNALQLALINTLNEF